MIKYYYNNELNNQNITAKPNIAWVADITTVEIDEDVKLHVFLLIDIHTNTVIGFAVSRDVFKSHRIIKAISQALDRRFHYPPKTKVIIHTDRGSQFSSGLYKKFTEVYNQFFLPSMSRERTPKDNAVAERFMRTFKEHKIDGIKLNRKLYLETHAFGQRRSYRSIVKRYIDSLNEAPNLKSGSKAPHKHDMDSKTASMFMVEPIHTKGFSNRFGEDQRRGEINRYKSENAKVVSILEELAAKRAEVVENTPFDECNYEERLALKLIDDRFKALYDMLEKSPLLFREVAEEALEPIEASIDELHKKIDKLLPKDLVERKVLPLRDPLDSSLFPIFLLQAGSSFKYTKDLKRAQIRIAYTILYHTGLRVNEIRHLTEEGIKEAIQASQFSVIQHKTKQASIHVLSEAAIKDLNNLKLEFVIVFKKYKYKYLFGKNKPIGPKVLIKTINDDLRHTCQISNIPYNIKSHSFRINMVSSLLKVITVQDAAQIIGHKNITSTMAYSRYSLSKKEIQDILTKAQESVNKNFDND